MWDAVEESMTASITTIEPSASRALDRSSTVEKWPVCRMAAFVILVCGAFWLGVGGLVALAIGAF